MRIGIKKIVATCLHESLGHHATFASHNEFSEPLDEVINQLPFFLLSEKEGVHVNVHFFLEEAARKRASKSSQQVIELFDSLRNHSKATFLRVLMNSWV